MASEPSRAAAATAAGHEKFSAAQEAGRPAQRHVKGVSRSARIFLLLAGIVLLLYMKMTWQLNWQAHEVIRLEKTRDGLEGKSRARGGGGWWKGHLVFKIKRRKTKRVEEVVEVTPTCDLLQGKWVQDKGPPPYTNLTCHFISPKQNCRRNGRPNLDYESWQWRPSGCSLPLFDAQQFLLEMKGKRILFAGDSLARNFLESLICMLATVEQPEVHSDSFFFSALFPSHSLQIVRVWSAWLVQPTFEPVADVAAGTPLLHLSYPDAMWFDLIGAFDVVLLSHGHWFIQPAVFVMDHRVVGGTVPMHSKRPWKVPDEVAAFTIATRTVLEAVASRGDFRGLFFLLPYTPDHYEGGTWRTGGRCDSHLPAKDGKAAWSKDGEEMFRVQKAAFDDVAASHDVNRSRFVFMDITKSALSRRDAHPGQFRLNEEEKKTVENPNRVDCLHWCLPGPTDKWISLLLKEASREQHVREAELVSGRVPHEPEAREKVHRR